MSRSEKAQLMITHYEQQIAISQKNQIFLDAVPFGEFDHLKELHGEFMGVKSINISPQVYPHTCISVNDIASAINAVDLSGYHYDEHDVLQSIVVGGQSNQRALSDNAIQLSSFRVTINGAFDRYGPRLLFRMACEVAGYATEITFQFDNDQHVDNNPFIHYRWHYDNPSQKYYSNKTKIKVLEPLIRDEWEGLIEVIKYADNASSGGNVELHFHKRNGMTERELGIVLINELFGVQCG